MKKYISIFVVAVLVFGVFFTPNLTEGKSFIEGKIRKTEPSIPVFFPDLIVEDFTWRPFNPIVNTNPGGYLYFSVLIKNQGTAPAFLPTGTSIGLYKDGEFAGRFTVGTGQFTLAAGASKKILLTSSQTPNILAEAGFFDLTVVVDDPDPVHLVNEINEENNSLTKQIFIRPLLADQFRF